ncbi:MAG: hypothetical protein J6331_00770 [Lentisphaeria bacterium]|nr:hypothetical protein [Lentisphaeria bacterium]
MDFFRTVWQTIFSPSGFSRLAERSFFRALFYYLILAVLLGVIFSSLEGCGTGREIRQACSFLFEKTGGFRIGKEGLVTVRTPEEKKEYEIVTSRGRMRIDYLPTAKISPSDMDTWEQDTLYGVILLRNAVLSWTKYAADGSAFMVMFAPLENKFPNVPAVQVLDREEFSSFVSKVGKPTGVPADLRGELKRGEYKDPSALSRILEGFVSFGNLCILLLQYIFLGLFTVGFFILLQLFRMGPDGKRLPLKTNAVITLFAALPGLLAGAVIQSFHIPFLDFQNVFLLVFFLYDILAFHAYCTGKGRGDEEEKTGEDGHDGEEDKKNEQDENHKE